MPAHMRSIPLGDRALFNLLFALQHVEPAGGAIQALRNDVRTRIARHLGDGGPGTVTPVEEVAYLSPSAFRSRYLATGTPVIIKGGAAKWPCTQRWSFEQFQQRFGQASLKLVHHKGLADDDIVLEQEYTEEMNFGEFLDQVQRGGMKYMRFAPILEMFPELVDDFDRTFLSSMPGAKSLGTTFEAFIGGPNTFTPLHNAPTPFFFVNVCGVKRWALIPNHYLAVLDPPADGMSYNHSGADVNRPDPERYPGLESLDRLEAVLEPGDIFFMPSWLWHSVQNESPTIGVRCGLMIPQTMLSESATLFLIRVFAAHNPSLLRVLYYTMLKRNLPDRKDMLLQPKMYWNFKPLQDLTDSPLLQRVMGGAKARPGNR